MRVLGSNRLTPQVKVMPRRIEIGCEAQDMDIWAAARRTARPSSLLCTLLSLGRQGMAHCRAAALSRRPSSFRFTAARIHKLAIERVALGRATMRSRMVTAERISAGRGFGRRRRRRCRHRQRWATSEAYVAWRRRRMNHRLPFSASPSHVAGRPLLRHGGKDGAFVNGGTASAALHPDIARAT